MIKGHLKININRKEYIINPGEMFMCYAGAIFEQLEFDPDCRFIFLAFNRNSLFPEHSSYSLTTIWDKMMTPKKFALEDENIELCKEFVKLFLQATTHIKDQGLKRECCIGLVKSSIACATQWYNDKKTHSQEKGISRDEILFTKFIQDVRENCHKEREIGFYASKFNMSPKYFSRLIFNVSGSYASYWIKNMIINEAKILLKSKNLNVQEVSDKLNFPNASFFGKYFKSSVGLTPRQYILSNKD